MVGVRRKKTPRRSNEERRAQSRAAVLDATIKAIVRYGYRGATSARIAELSGFTRGAQKHHFRNKAEMVAEAMEHLHDQMAQQLIELLRATEKASLSEHIAFVWEVYQGDLYLALAELHTVARMDVMLRTALRPAERRMHKRLSEARGLWRRDWKIAPERSMQIEQHVVNVLRGMAFQRLLEPNPEYEAAQLRVLEEAVRALLRAS